MKFGGAALSNIKKIKKAAGIICQKRQKYSRITIVVSAMGKTTDELLSLAKKITVDPPKREQDMLITAGERISMSLLAMALYENKVDAVSFTGSQSGIITTSDHFDARILEIRPERIVENLNKNKVVIVAGFQGVSREREVTTLGRGGSDTTAVALAVALKSDAVEFYKDVEGVFSADPKLVFDAEKLENITYDQAISLVKTGAKVLDLRCLELAKKHGVFLRVLSYKKNCSGTVIFDKKPFSGEI